MSDIYWKFIEDAITHPDTAPLVEGDKNQELLAFAMSLSITPENFEGATQYLHRLPFKWEMLAVGDAIRRDPGLMMTRAGITWMIKNAGQPLQETQVLAYDQYINTLGRAVHEALKGGTHGDNPEPVAPESSQ